MGVVSGSLLGLLQWLALTRAFRWPWPWIVVTTLGGLLGAWLDVWLSAAATR